MAKQPRQLIKSRNHYKVPLSNGTMALISSESEPFVKNYCWTGHSLGSKTTYAYRRPKSGKVYLHQFVAECAGIEVPDGFEIDHINNNGLDNRISNLRVVTRAVNCRNRRDSLKEPVLYEYKRTGLWRAVAKITVPLGVYKTRQEAVNAYTLWLLSGCPR